MGQVEGALSGRPDHLQQITRSDRRRRPRRRAADTADITLVAVSKAQPEERVLAALEAGQRIFGENYVQPALARWPSPQSSAHPGCAASHDRSDSDQQGERRRRALRCHRNGGSGESLQERLAKEMAAQDRRRPSCLVQVNTGEEPQKSGIHPAETDQFVRFCRDELSLPVAGLMCVPPVDDEPAMHFALLAKIASSERPSRSSRWA